MTDKHTAPDNTAAEDVAQALYSKTHIVTQDLERDIIQFLSAKHTANATLTIAEIMRFYDCPEDRARRVAKGLVAQNVLVVVGKDQYKVNV